MSTSSSFRFYVYVLARPNGKPFYVGKGTKNRIWWHEGKAKRNDCACHKCNTIRKIWEQGGQVQRYVVLVTNDEKEALQHEQDTIALYGVETLCNHTHGGEGYVPTDEQREKFRQRQLQRFQDPVFVERYRAGCAKRDSHKAALKAVETRRRNGDEARRALLRQRAIEQFSDPVQRERLRQQAVERNRDPAQRQKTSEQQKARWQDPEYRARMIEAMNRRRLQKEASNGESTT